MVAGEPGLPDFRLSDEDSGRRPRNWRTDDGRRDGLVGDKELLAASLVRLCCNWPSVVASPEPLPLTPVPSGNSADSGVGCDDSGPLPGVGGRGVSGGESSGAGIDVPSVREKLMGVSVSGLYLPTAMVLSQRLSLGADGSGAIESAQALLLDLCVICEVYESRRAASRWRSGGPMARKNVWTRV